MENIRVRVNKAIEEFKRKVEAAKVEVAEKKEEYFKIYKEAEAEKRFQELVEEVYSLLKAEKEELVHTLQKEVETASTKAEKMELQSKTERVKDNDFYRASKLIEIADTSDSLEAVVREFSDEHVRLLAEARAKSLDQEEIYKFNGFMNERKAVNLVETASINLNYFDRAYSVEKSDIEHGRMNYVFNTTGGGNDGESK